MKTVRFASLFLCFVSTALLAQSHPLPMVYQPLTPTSVRPGHNAWVLKNSSLPPNSQNLGDTKRLENRESHL
jgi:hypothetical protein